MRFTGTRGGPEVGWREAIDTTGPIDTPPGGSHSHGTVWVPTHLPPTFDAEGSELSFGAWSVARAATWFDEPVHDLGLREALDLPLRLRALGPDLDLLDLTGGATGAFKDVGARVLVSLWSAWPRDDARKRCVLVATSGDTGGAVAAAVEGLSRVRAVIVFPLGRVSEPQRRHFTTRGAAVRAVGVRGTFDDCQRIVREALRSDLAVTARCGSSLRGEALVSANSINPGRLLPQALYYGWAAARAPGRPLVVPSGNLGNLTSAVLARAMGAPLGPLLAAVNENDALVRASRGETPRAGPAVATDSNAMDVAAPSNLERLEWLARLTARPLAALVDPLSIPVDEARRAQRWAFETYGKVIDPHTAVGVARAVRLRAKNPGVRPIVVETAHPAKFPEQVREVIGCDPPLAPHLERPGPEAWSEIEPRVEALLASIAESRDATGDSPSTRHPREGR